MTAGGALTSPQPRPTALCRIFPLTPCVSGELKAGFFGGDDPRHHKETSELRFLGAAACRAMQLRPSRQISLKCRV